MRSTLTALGGVLLVVQGCSGDAYIDLFQPAPGARADAGRGSAGDQGDAGDDVPAGQLVLRYDFEGTGTVVQDRAGSANGLVVGGAALDGTGVLALDGVDDYVDMPNGVASRRASATFMAWVEWEGGVCWQRIFDFGKTDAGENESGMALSSFYVTGSSCPDGVLTATIELGSRHHSVTAESALPDGRPVQVTLAVDAARNSTTLYVDGEQVGSTSYAFALESLDDVNAWLGRSQWIQDHNLKARYDEFRIYAGALSGARVAELYARGPDLP